MKLSLAIVALLPALVACDALKDRMGIPDPAKVEAEGKAVGGACRLAGRGLEDCYALNPRADKAAVFSGWKEMNEYMIKNNMQVMVPQAAPAKPAASEAKAAEPEAAKPEAKPAAGH
ncbi:hypothetical protein EZJ19_05870 [Parasulfuritortus cantonensis]|uniref:Uncharacterized protein n=1 Tax=Parasulfuritortus cantonensis TaxID=2528202 RepID=A0A4R1BFS7_9PROT|nr:hypothetical protein [Parasulfuritortus cantonensis]TCJ15984.1 hypothetical protein EZJ19_05870 [Parasulfuritortus cantonensis]